MKTFGTSFLSSSLNIGTCADSFFRMIGGFFMGDHTFLVPHFKQVSAAQKCLENLKNIKNFKNEIIKKKIRKFRKIRK